MTKKELVDVIASKTEMTKKDSEAALSAVVESIKEALIKGDDIRLVGFGTFSVKETAARTGRNPKTGEEIKIPAGKRVAFKASKELKEVLK